MVPLGNGLDRINTLHAVGETQRRLDLERNPYARTRFLMVIMFSVAFSQFTTFDPPVFTGPCIQRRVYDLKIWLALVKQRPSARRSLL